MIDSNECVWHVKESDTILNAHAKTVQEKAAFLRVNTGESPSARSTPACLSVLSLLGATAIALLHVAVSSVCFDKSINLQNHTLKMWDHLEINTCGVMRQLMQQ